MFIAPTSPPFIATAPLFLVGDQNGLANRCTLTRGLGGQGFSGGVLFLGRRAACRHRGAQSKPPAGSAFLVGDQNGLANRCTLARGLGMPLPPRAARTRPASDRQGSKKKGSTSTLKVSRSVFALLVALLIFFFARTCTLILEFLLEIIHFVVSPIHRIPPRSQLPTIIPLRQHHHLPTVLFGLAFRAFAANPPPCRLVPAAICPNAKFAAVAYAWSVTDGENP